MVVPTSPARAIPQALGLAVMQRTVMKTSHRSLRDACGQRPYLESAMSANLPGPHAPSIGVNKQLLDNGGSGQRFDWSLQGQIRNVMLAAASAPITVRKRTVRPDLISTRRRVKPGLKTPASWPPYSIAAHKEQ